MLHCINIVSVPFARCYYRAVYEAYLSNKTNLPSINKLAQKNNDFNLFINKYSKQV